MLQINEFLEMYSKCTDRILTEQDLDTRITELGMNSLSMLLLLRAVEEAYQITVPLKELNVSSSTTLSDLYTQFRSFTVRRPSAE